MQRILDILFGHVGPGVERSISFNSPHWMSWGISTPRIINALLFAIAIAIVYLIYRRDGRRTGARIGLGILRGLLFLYLIVLINRPILQVTRTDTEPSVLAVLVDDSISMSVHDVNPDGTPADHATISSGPAMASSNPTRLAAVIQTLSGDNQALLKRLAKVHELRFYSFDKDARPIGSTPGPKADPDAPAVGGVGPLSTLSVTVILCALAIAAATIVWAVSAFRRGSSPQGVMALAACLACLAMAAYPIVRQESLLQHEEQLSQADGPRHEVSVQIEPKLVEAIHSLSPDGMSTQVVPSLVTVLDDLQGQRLAGVVIITDARETPAGAPQAMLDRLKKYSTHIYPVPVGSVKAPTNIELVSISVQDSAFKGDIVAARVQVRGTGYEPGKTVRVRLIDRKNKNLPLKAPDGRDAEKIFTLPDDRAVEEEIPFLAQDLGLIEVAAVADLQPGELDDKDNERDAQVAVLDAKINVLYVEGYPRWEYRYLKNAIIRDSAGAKADGRKGGDHSLNISCWLTSADPSFTQEGSRPEPDFGPTDPRTGEKFPGPITRFPETMAELMKYDVVLFGDVDPRMFTDSQLQMVSDFVNKKGGGFGMVAGPQHSPIAYRNTAIEAVLPVYISHVLPDDPTAEYKEGFRPLVTDEGRRGEASTIFRFFDDKAQNEKYLRDDLQPVFWYCRGISVKPAGMVYAEHPFDSDPNTGRKAPLLVLGRFGAGRTLFSAIDDTWRWRYYTGESVFDKYWVGQLRYLARSRKLGQRRANFTVSRDSYELGEQVTLDLNVMDPTLSTQLPPQLRVEIVDEATGQTIRQEALQRQEDSPEHFSANFVADRVGKFNVRLPSQLTDGQQGLDPTGPHLEVIVPRLELSKPAVDQQMLQTLASLLPGNQIVPLAEAPVKLPQIIKSAAVKTPKPNPRPLLDGWGALMIFVLLLTSEWVLRKVFGMI